MRIYIFFGSILTLLGLVSCENFQQQYEEEMLKQKLLADSLLFLEEEERLIKGEYSETMETLSAIEEALADIAANNKRMDALIREKGLTDDEEQQQRIMVQLGALQKANNDTYGKAKSLRSKARAYKVENQQLKNMIANLEKRFEEKEAELGQLRTTIGQMQVALSDLENEVSMTDSKLADAYAGLKIQTENLEKANNKLAATIEDLQNKNDFIAEDAVGYIACGSRKILRQNKIITLLSMKRLTKDYRDRVKEIGTPISIFNDNSMDCGEGEIIYMLPERDPGSYRIQGATLQILDKKKFWTTSKAVVLVKK